VSYSPHYLCPPSPTSIPPGANSAGTVQYTNLNVCTLLCSSCAFNPLPITCLLPPSQRSLNPFSARTVLSLKLCNFLPLNSFVLFLCALSPFLHALILTINSLSSHSLSFYHSFSYFSLSPFIQCWGSMTFRIRIPGYGSGSNYGSDSFLQ
jgi:hypothetical protein